MIPIFLSEIVRTVIIMTITGGLLCLLLLLIKPVIRNRLPKSAQYYFWLVALAALLVPISRMVVMPDAAPNIVPVHNIVERNIISVNEHEYLQIALFIRPADFVPTPADRVLLPIPPAPLSAIFSTIFMFVYPWVVLLVLFYNLAGYFRFVKKLSRDYVSPSYFELSLLGELSEGKRTPTLIKSTYAVTPMLIGIFKPIIVLPDCEYTDEQLHSIFLHELTHMRRFDVLVKWFSLIACAVHWFNPFVWVLRREISRTCELACDEAVIRNMDNYNKQNYGETLITVASDKKIPLPVLSTTMCAEKRVIKERLVAIMKNKKRTKTAVLMSAVIFLAAVFTACAVGVASGSPSDENTVTDYSFMDRVVADGVRVFVLENMTDRERFERMTSVTLYADGTATIATALISSRMVHGAPYTIFTVEDNELVFFQTISGNEEIARFTIIDNDTLEFRSTGIPLFADVGARYVFSADGFNIFAVLEYDNELTAYGGSVTPFRGFNPGADRIMQFETYAEFGLIHDPITDHLYFNGELVRYFEDWIALSYGDGQSTFFGISHFTESGTVDVRAIRDVSQPIRNPDGSIDPSGILVGIVPFSQDEFDARDIDAFLNPPSNSAHSSGGVNNTNIEANPNAQGGNIATLENDGLVGTGIYEIFTGVEDYGITFSGNIFGGCGGNIYYNGRLVRVLISDNNVILSSFDSSGDIIVRIVRDSDGNLTGLEVVNIIEANVTINEIAPGEAVPVARVVMGDDNIYTVEVISILFHFSKLFLTA